MQKVQRAVPDPFIKDQNREYLWINNLNCYKFVYIVCPGEGVSKYFNPISSKFSESYYNFQNFGNS